MVSPHGVTRTLEAAIAALIIGDRSQPMRAAVEFVLNGQQRAEFVESGATLLTLLREKVGITSPKGGCLQGTCGCCTVLLDGAPYLACLVLAQTCTGKSIETVEGLAQATTLHALQEA